MSVSLHFLLFFLNPKSKEELFLTLKYAQWTLNNKLIVIEQYGITDFVYCLESQYYLDFSFCQLLLQMFQ